MPLATRPMPSLAAPQKPETFPLAVSRAAPSPAAMPSVRNSSPAVLPASVPALASSGVNLARVSFQSPVPRPESAMASRTLMYPWAAVSAAMRWASSSADIPANVPPPPASAPRRPPVLRPTSFTRPDMAEKAPEVSSRTAGMGEKAPLASTAASAAVTMASAGPPLP